MKGQKLIPLVVVGVALLAYHNSFSGPFIYDDGPSILENPTIRHLWPITRVLRPPHANRGITVEGRPLINLSLAVNYALGGTNVWGYHAFNLAIHILAGLALLGIVRRTLRQPGLRDRFGGAANELALAVALIWTVHPLQTESVTYVAQRAESIMGLLYLATLYCFLRGADSPRPGLWYGLSVMACAMGMATKEVMVTAPVVVLLYDRAFLAGSFREAWRRRKPVYLGLAGTWVLLGFILAHGQLPVTRANARRLGLTWWQYLATEPGVVLHYLRLSVWPQPLCFDYHGWPMAKNLSSVVPPALVIVLLLGLTVWACGTTASSRGWRAICGFWGAWFFLILAPSSSVIPLDSPAYEHRMYLPLAAVVVLGVLGIYALAGRRSVAVFGVLVMVLTFLTLRRNLDYRSELAIWQDTVLKRPNNSRAHTSLGAAFKSLGRVQEGIEQYQEALRLEPDNPEANNNLGNALLGLNQVPDAVAHFERALRTLPGFAEAHNNLGVALARLGMLQEAIQHWEQALRIKPDFAEAHNNLGLGLMRTGQIQEAIGHYEQALRIKPDYADAHYNLGLAMEQVGRLPEAMSQYEQALRIRPDYAEVRKALARLRYLAS